MADQPVAHRPRDLDHTRPDTRHPDPRWAVRARRRGEQRGHQRVGVEVTAVERLAFVPAPPDRPHGLDQLAHPRRRPGPGHRVAALDVRPDLAAEPQHEPPAREHLHVVAEVGQRHRRAGEGDGDGRPSSMRSVCSAATARGRNPSWRTSKVKSPRSRRPRRRRPAPAGQVVQEVAVDLHPGSLPGVHSPPLFAAARPWNHHPHDDDRLPPGRRQVPTSSSSTPGGAPPTTCRSGRSTCSATPCSRPCSST